MGHRDAGFTLFEVLIAFAVMTLVLAALLPAQSALSSRAARSGEQALAMDYSASLQAELELSPVSTTSAERFIYRNWEIFRSITHENDRLLRATIVIKTHQGIELARLDSLYPVP